jgi:ATP-binding cassette subfamily B (MDR/TAP) protein 1
LRIALFQAALIQEISFHENTPSAQLVTLIDSEIQIVQEAFGDKLPQFCLYTATFISGFAISIIKSWRLGLLLGLTVLPSILFSGWAIQTLGAKFACKATAVYSRAAAMSEEMVSSIRTVYAFNAQHKLLDLYHDKLVKSLTYSTRKSLSKAAVIGTAIFIIFSAYALAFYYGTILLLAGNATAGQSFRLSSFLFLSYESLKPWTGDVISVFFAILVSCLGLSSAAPILDCEIYYSHLSGLL